jgi:phosphoribosylformimino-5-aminoimidazole carboxamide ribotide isomerase
MIIPCIDLMDGKVVQLVQGREKALEGDSPEEMLRRFAAFPEDSGHRSRRRHGPRLERRSGAPAGRARGARVGGGVRTVERARTLLEQGAHRVIVGTAAFTADGPNDAFLARSVAPSARRIIALDSKGGRIVVKGWREATNFTAEEVLRSWSLTAPASSAPMWIRKA